MSVGSSTFGRQAEAAAERYLRERRYRILERNARSVYGELDLIVEQGRVLVFVEVKARTTAAYGGAPYAVDARKQQRLIRLAAHYLSTHALRDRSCRFDVLLCRRGTDSIHVEHIENAFEVPGDQLQW